MIVWRHKANVLLSFRFVPLLSLGTLSDVIGVLAKVV